MQHTFNPLSNPGPHLQEVSSATRPLTQLPDPSSRVRSDSLSSAALSDFYEAFDFLESEEKEDESVPDFFKVSCAEIPWLKGKSILH